MADARLIDLHHLGQPRALAAYLLTKPEPTLVDCGPASCLPALERGLADAGIRVGDLRHLLITHVHLDHAGAAGRLVAANPHLQVHVSEIGARHLTDPSRLERSARRLFGGDFDRLWGAVVPVPAENVRVTRDRAAGLDCFPTPGHAIHHVSYLTSEGSCVSGDATGVRIFPSSYIAPATPPPDIDLAAYARSLSSIEARDPQRLCLPHFGVFEDPPAHLARMREGLERWAAWVRDGASKDEFVAAAEAELERTDPSAVQAIAAAAPFPTSYLGLKRYWEVVRQRAGAASARADGG